MGERTRELLTLIGGDIFFFNLALWLTLLLRYFEWPDIARLSAHMPPFLMLSGVWILGFFISGLYDKHTTFLKKLLVTKIIYAQIINFVIAVFVFLSFPFGIAPKTNLVIYLVISTLLIAWWRLYGFKYFSPKEKHSAILIADGDDAVELVDEINNNDRYNYRFVRMVDEKIIKETENFQEKILSLIERKKIRVIVANPNNSQLNDFLPQLFDLAFLRFEFTFLDFNKLYEDTFDRAPIASLEHGWFISHVSQSRTLIYASIKRAIDILGALILAVPALLVFPVVALAIKLDDKGPLIYRTERVGQFNQPINIYKFRTKNGSDNAASALNSKLVDTRVGVLLRKTRLDELPQLLNVLKGDLSFIGPRPEIPSLAKVYAKEIPYYNARHFLKPGLSGWAQINNFDVPRGGVDVQKTTTKLSYDLYYLKRRSLLLDIQIALKTIFTILMRTGT